MNSQTLAKIAAFADQHARPIPSRIKDDAVRIYSVERLPSGELITVAADVRSFAEARAVLGY